MIKCSDPHQFSYLPPYSEQTLYSLVFILLSSVQIFTTEGDDYIPVSITLEWHYDSPSLIQCVKIPIVNDECVEEKEEEFRVSLLSDQDCVLLGLNYTTVTIVDDDSKCSYIFVTCLYLYRVLIGNFAQASSLTCVRLMFYQLVFFFTYSS